MRALESQVSEIKETQKTICSNIQEILSFVRATGHPSRSPSMFPPSFHHSSPSVNSPSMSTPTVSHQQVNEIHHPSPTTGPPRPIIHPPAARQARVSMPNIYPQGQAPPLSEVPPPHGPQPPPFSSANPTDGGPPVQPYPPGQALSNTVLPPFSSITMPPPQAGNNVSSLRYHPHDPKVGAGGQRYPAPASGSKRQIPPSSNITSADSSDIEDDDDGGLPASGLVAPWEVLRGLADVAIERAAKVHP